MSILLTGTTRLRLLRKCRTCSCREDASVLLRKLWLQDSLCGRMLRDTQFPNGCIVRCNVRCLRVKTQGILPRSEVTMEVRRCQCAYRRVHELRRRDGEVKLVEHVAGSCDGVLELSGGLRWVRCRVFVNRRFGRKCVPRQSQPPRRGGTVMVSQNSVLGQESLIRASALVRPGVVIVARKCKSTYVSTSRLLVAGKQYSSLGKRAVERSMWL